MPNSFRNGPRLDSLNLSATAKRKAVMASSSVHYVGEIFDYATGTNGAQTVATDNVARGIVADIKVKQTFGYVSAGDKSITSYLGTYVAPTLTAPAKYTATSTNATVAKEYVTYYPLNIGDRLTLQLGNGSGGYSARGTTTGSNLLNYFIEIDGSNPWQLLESSTNASATGKQFKIVGFPENDPTNSYVIVELINATGAVS